MSDGGFAEIPTTLSEQVQRRIAASKDYDMLMGLVSMWMGAGFLMMALMSNIFWFAIFAWVGTAISISWYEKRFGKQRSSHRRIVTTLLLSLPLILLITAGAFVDHFNPQPILVTPLASAGAMAVANLTGYRHIGTTVWHWVAVVGLALCTVGPLVGWHPSGTAVLTPLGIALLITGFVDHQRLTSIFGKVEPA